MLCRQAGRISWCAATSAFHFHKKPIVLHRQHGFDVIHAYASFSVANRKIASYRLTIEWNFVLRIVQMDDLNGLSFENILFQFFRQVGAAVDLNRLAG